MTRVPPSISIWIATISGTLRDAVVVVIGRRAHRARHAARDASLERAAIEPGVGAAPVRARAAECRPLRLVCRAQLCGLGLRRHTAVGWIDHQRRPWCRHLGAAIPPEIVVGTLDVAACALAAPLVAILVLRALLERRDLFGGEELTARDVRRTLERSNRPVREVALQVGLTPRCARGRQLLRRRRGIGRRRGARGLSRDGSR